MTQLRELLEETGFASDEWSYLGAVEPNPAFQIIFATLVGTKTSIKGAQLLGEGEAIQIEFLSQKEITAAVQGGELKHALALSALSRVFNLWEESLTRSQGLKIVKNRRSVNEIIRKVAVLRVLQEA